MLAPMSDIPGATDLERLVARSRLLGADPTLVVHGGGNTSTKTRETDHRGRERPTLRIKGSGTDLKTIGADGFPGLWLDDLLPLRERSAMSDEVMAACLTLGQGHRRSLARKPTGGPRSQRRHGAAQDAPLHVRRSLGRPHAGGLT